MQPNVSVDFSIDVWFVTVFYWDIFVSENVLLFKTIDYEMRLDIRLSKLLTEKTPPWNRILFKQLDSYFNKSEYLKCSLLYR